MTGPIVLAAGGTGGHMFPAEALAHALRARGCDVALVTDIRGQAFGADEGVAVHRIRAATLRPGIAGKLVTMADLAVCTLRARRLLKGLKPAAVVGFGGYPSVPTVYAAQSMGIPTALHEQNAVLGRANRLLAGRAALVATSFPSVRGLPANGRRERTGNPVRPAIAALREQPYPALPVAGSPLGGPISILVTGGSQGAAVFSEVVPAALGRLPEAVRTRLRVAQQARPETLEQARAAYAGTGIAVELEPFFRDMPVRLAGCHLAICRSGASTVAELTACGRPAVLVPYPHAIDDHQTANAAALAEAGGAWLMPQPAFTADSLAERLGALLADPPALAAAAAASLAWGIPDAADRLADAVLSLTRSNGAARATPQGVAA